MTEQPLNGESLPASSYRELERRVVELEREIAVLKQARREFRRLTIPRAAAELGWSVKELQDLIDLHVLPVCNATTRPRVPMEDAERILRERFTIREVVKA